MNINIKLAVILLVYTTSSVFSQSERFGLQEKPGSRIPQDIFLTNENYQQVSLSQIIDKPTLINFVYYRCPGLCTPMLEGIAEAINYTKSKLGQDYQVITISIDHNESENLAIKKKSNYMKLINKQDARNGWHFYTTDSLSIKRLTDATGWEFKRRGDNFVHPAVTVLITPSGVISQYFYGTYFNYVHLQMSIDDAWQEKINPVRLKNMKYCYNFDPPKNFNTEIVTKIFGLLVILIALALFFYLAVIPNFRKP